MSTETSFGQSLDTYIRAVFGQHRGYDGLNEVLSSIADGAQKIHQKVQSAALTGLLGSSEIRNVHGEIVQRLDIESTRIFVDALSQSGCVAAIGGEELEHLEVFSGGEQLSYVVLMDPIDGSSNMDVAVSIGSIFGIWRRTLEIPVTESAILKPGFQQIAAAYIIYGSSTILVVATTARVVGFTLDVTSDTFRLTHPKITMPAECQYYSTNEGNFAKLDKVTQMAVTELREAYSLRYVGSLVVDFHRNLLKGGIFLYPGDTKNPQGKLRLMYEASPLGFIAVQAGGAASSGKSPILDIQPQSLHQRIPLIIGNKDVVSRTVEIMTS